MIQDLIKIDPPRGGFLILYSCLDTIISMAKNDKQASQQAPQNVSVSINPDTTPILYTDNMLINVNDDGVIIDVAQRVGNSSRIVARIGMSRSHAKKFAAEIGRLLALTEGKSKTGNKA